MTQQDDEATAGRNAAPETDSGRGLVTPLRKRQPTGEVYRRTPKVEALVAELLQLPREDMLARAEVTHRADPRFLPSECLLYFIRASRDEASQSWFERLYRILAGRVLRSVPKPEMQGAVSLIREKVRDYVSGRFAEMLSADRLSYQERLDFFEVRFDSAMANLRRDAQEQAWRDHKRSQPIEYSDDSGDVLPEVEAAAQRQNEAMSSVLDDRGYRLQLDAAIDALPDDQRRIIHMLRLGIPIDSKERGVMTIARALGRSEKTIRNHRDKALAALRSALRAGGQS